MEDENEDILPVYNVKVGETEAKAIDIIALRQWIMVKEGEASILNIDSTKTTDMRVSELQARVMQQNWMELKSMLDDVLGLNQVVDEPDQPPEPAMTVPLPEKPTPLEAVPEVAPQAQQQNPSPKTVITEQQTQDKPSTPAPHANFIPPSEQPQQEPDDQMIEL